MRFLTVSPLRLVLTPLIACRGITLGAARCRRFLSGRMGFLALVLTLGIQGAAAEEYIFPTPFSEAHCRWTNTLGQTVHVYEGPRSPGFAVDSAWDCGHAVRTLLLTIHGRFMSFGTWSGRIEFRHRDGRVEVCHTEAVGEMTLSNEPELLDYALASRARRATLEQLRALRGLLDQRVRVICESPTS